jgi:hypothetical protein
MKQMPSIPSGQPHTEVEDISEIEKHAPLFARHLEKIIARLEAADAPGIILQGEAISLDELNRIHEAVVGFEVGDLPPSSLRVVQKLFDRYRVDRLN